MTYEQAVALAARTSLATPLAQRQAVIEVLREAASDLEHGAEFNMTRTSRWSPARQAENDRAIHRSRELQRLADGLDETSWTFRASREAVHATNEPDYVTIVSRENCERCRRLLPCMRQHSRVSA